MNVIEVKELKKVFGSKQVLKGINFQVKKGNVFGFLGPNGAGKTTTIRIILGLLTATHGTALVLGHNLGIDGTAKKRVGVLLEEDGIYPRLSAIDNLNYFARLYEVKNAESRINEVLELVGLKDHEREKTGHYSKGMKRRLGLARSMLHRPEILMMDEPSSGLDPEAQKLVRDIILRLSKEEVTIFLNSHDLDEVQRICSHVAILQDGRIKALDTVRNLTSVKTPSINIILENAEEAQRGEKTAREFNCVTGVNRNDSILEINLDSKDSTNLLLDSFIKNNIKIEEVKKLERSLEDIYLEAVKEEQNE